MVERPFRLRILLRQGIVQYDLVPLYQTLTVLLPMFELLVSVTLNSFQKGGECKLLRMAQLGLFLLDNCLHFRLQFIPFEFFQEVRLHFDSFRLVITLHPN